MLLLMEEIPHRMVCFVKRKNHSLSIASREMELMILEKSIYENDLFYLVTGILKTPISAKQCMKSLLKGMLAKAELFDNIS